MFCCRVSGTPDNRYYRHSQGVRPQVHQEPEHESKDVRYSERAKKGADEEGD
jgi:hypothetical protein